MGFLIGLGTISIAIGVLFGLLPTGTGFSPEIHTAFQQLGSGFRVLNFILPIDELLTVLPFALLYASTKMIFRVGKWLVGYARGYNT